jgi:hypothetical protein
MIATEIGDGLDDADDGENCHDAQARIADLPSL